MERHSLPRRFAPGEDAAGRRSSQANLGTASGSCWGLVPTDSAPYLLSSPCVSPCETVVDRLLGPISQCGIVPVAVPMNDSNAAVRMVSSGICECGSPSSGYRPLAAVFAASWFILCMPDVSRTVQKLCKRNRAAADADALAERTAGSPGGESRRSAAWDNARFLLMVLVVCGHLGEPFLWQNAQPLASIGLWLNLWVMPSFVFVSGLWSPGHNPAARHYLSTFSIGLVYAVNQSLLIAVCILVPSLPITPAACDELLIGRSDCAEPVTGWSNLLSGLFQPTWQMWYLYCLILWRILTPVFLTLRPLPAIMSAFILGSLSGYVELNVELQKGLSYFPFYVLGASLKQHKPLLSRLDKIMASSWSRLAGAAVLSFWMVLYWCFYTGRVQSDTSLYYCMLDFWITSFYMGNSWQFCGAFGAFFWRFATNLVQMSCVCAFWAFVPKIRTPCTSFGSRTLSPFILHPYIVLFVSHLGFYDTPSLVRNLALQDTSTVLFAVVSKLFVCRLLDGVGYIAIYDEGRRLSQVLGVGRKGLFTTTIGDRQYGSDNTDLFFQLAALIIGLVTTAALSTAIVAKIFTPLINPLAFAPWIIRPELAVEMKLHPKHQPSPMDNTGGSRVSVQVGRDCDSVGDGRHPAAPPMLRVVPHHLIGMP